jgi:hypothetical protein
MNAQVKPAASKSAAQVVELTLAQKKDQIKELGSRYLTLDPAEKKTLEDLTKDVKHAIDKRKESLESLHTLIKNIEPTIDELFKPEELKAMIMATDWKPSDLFPSTMLKGKAPKASASEGSDESKRPSDSTELLLKRPQPAGQKGQAFTYHKGRAFEGHVKPKGGWDGYEKSDTVKPWQYNDQFPSALLEYGQTSEKLLELCVDAAARKYFTEDAIGKKELAKLVAQSVAAKKHLAEKAKA